MSTELGAEDATYLAIGRFIVEYSALEGDLRFLFGAELRLRVDLFDPVLTHDFALLCTAVLNVFKQTASDDRYRQLTKIVNKCRKINDLRVKVVHGEWMPQEEGGSLSHASRGSLRRAHLGRMKDMLEAKADEVHALRNDLDKFFHDHHEDKKAVRERGKKRAAFSKLFG
jgi:hypothetical protein